MKKIYCLGLIAAGVLSGLSATASAEVMAREIGPRSSIATNNTNSFDWTHGSSSMPPADCDPAQFLAEYGHQPCRGDMLWVCSRYFGVSVCADKDLAADQAGNPAGNFSRDTCAAYCAQQGERILTNNEWLVACTGTPLEPCLNYRGEWPPAFFAKDPAHPCATYGTGSSQCMSDPRLTRLMPPIDSACLSEAGLSGCIGTLGQWVSDDVSGTLHGRFNGGLFPQPASSVLYTTTAHSPAYSDYSIGCRCGRDVNTVK